MRAKDYRPAKPTNTDNYIMRPDTPRGVHQTQEDDLEKSWGDKERTRRTRDADTDLWVDPPLVHTQPEKDWNCQLEIWQEQTGP